MQSRVGYAHLTPFHWTAICSSSIVFTPRSLFLLFVLLFSGPIVEDLTTAATSPHLISPLCVVQFYHLPSPPPRAYPQGFAIFFSLGSLFPIPGHAERDDSLPPGLLIHHKYIVLSTKHKWQYWFPYNSKTRRFDKNLNIFLELLNEGHYMHNIIKTWTLYLKKKTEEKTNRNVLRHVSYSRYSTYAQEACEQIYGSI